MGWLKQIELNAKIMCVRVQDKEYYLTKRGENKKQQIK